MDGFVAHCLELLGAAGRARAKRMFGGHGLYVDDFFVAVIVEDRLFLKADADSHAAFEAAGCQRWVYDGKEAPVAMPYWSVPDEAMDSPPAMRPWVALALQAARRQALAKKPDVKKPAAKKTARKSVTKTPARRS